MKSSSWKDYAEPIGTAAIVASLIFVGMQMKQSQDIAASAIYQERTTASVDAALSLASNPTWITARLKADSGQVRTMTPEELLAARMAVFATSMLWDNSNHQYEQGFLPEDGWLRIRGDIRNAMKSAFTRDALLQLAETGRARPAMAELYREIYQELEAELGQAAE